MAPVLGPSFRLRKALRSAFGFTHPLPNPVSAKDSHNGFYTTSSRMNTLTSGWSLYTWKTLDLLTVWTVRIFLADDMLRTSYFVDEVRSWLFSIRLRLVRGYGMEKGI